MSKVTDRLLEAGAAGRRRRRATAPRSCCSDLLERHVGVAASLVAASRARRAGRAARRRTSRELTATVRRAGRRSARCRRASHDAIVAMGELASSRIVAAAFAAQGMPARVGRRARSVLVTDDEHTAAVPDMDATCERDARAGRAALARRRGRRCWAASSARPRTASRRRSAAAARTTRRRSSARASTSTRSRSGPTSTACSPPTRASWPSRALVPQLSFAEASELAYFGAKVLHPSTILPAVAKNIPVRILNSRRPEVPGTLITADGRRSHGRLTALACKRGVTVIDITSTRMLMAHGFLRRLFEVFERFKTAGGRGHDLGGQRVGDGRRHAPARRHRRQPAEFRRGRAASATWRSSASVGENLRADPALFGAAVTALDGDPAAAGVAGGVAAEHHVRAARRRRAAGDDAAARRALRSDVDARTRLMRILLVGHGKMGRLVGELAPAVRAARSPASSIPSRRAHRRRSTMPTLGAASTSRSTSRSPDAVVDQRAGARAARHQPRARHDRLAGARGGAARRRSPTPASASSPRRTSRPASCCSRRSSRRRRGCSRAQAEFGAWLHEAHHAAKKDAPSGTALLLKRAMERGGLSRGRSTSSSTRAGFIPGHAHGRLRRPGGIDYADAHGARPRGVRARRADGGALGPGQAAAGSRCTTCWGFGRRCRSASASCSSAGQAGGEAS